MAKKKYSLKAEKNVFNEKLPLEKEVAIQIQEAFRTPNRQGQKGMLI